MPLQLTLFDLASPGSDLSLFDQVLSPELARHVACLPLPMPNKAPVQPPAIPRDFRLTGERLLATIWRERARDNLAAIRLLKALAEGGRAATPEEQAALMRFTGFGASELATNCFLRPGEGGFRPGWQEIGQELRSLVSEQDYAALARATQYAHYTPAFLVRAIWAGLSRLGFCGGRILEPGMGTGLFLALMPEEIAVASHVTGIENDAVTAGIARLLYPSAEIRQEDFCRARLRDGYDLAIGNPPFSDRAVRIDPAYKALGLRLHDYFLAKAIDALRPGGLAAFVTSQGTMDKADDAARRYIASRADLLAAIRLPEQALQAEAGTHVGVDLLFFRRRMEGQEAGGADWLETVELLPGINVNRRIVSYDAMTLGRHDSRAGPFGRTYACLPHRDSDLIADLNEAITRLPRNLYQPTVATADDADNTSSLLPDLRIGTAAEKADLKEGSYFTGPEARLMQVLDGAPVEVPVRRPGIAAGMPARHARIIKALIPIRDALRAVLRAQAEDRPWQDAQRRLRSAYASFTAQFGPINLTTVATWTDASGTERETHRRPNLAPFLDDPDCWLVSSIEEFDLDTGIARRGQVFTQRVIAPPAAPVVSSATDALAVTLNEFGRVDVPHMAELLDSTPEAVLDELGEGIFENPDTGQWETADAYLSGRVRDKLAAAERAAAEDIRYIRNVEALRQVQPEDLKPSEITARLGAPWLPVSVVQDFCEQVMGARPTLQHNAAAAAWAVGTHVFAGTPVGTSEWGTHRRHAGDLLEDALNARIPQIYDSFKDADGKDRRELNVEATEAAKEKLTKIKAAFEAWVWTDPARAEDLCARYNLAFNNLVPRHFDGSHLTLPGASSAFALRGIQKRVIWRIIASGGTYIAHAVGAGKTLSIAAAIMEQRRLGLISKAMLVVPGHCLAQFSREFLQLYPQARILVADEQAFSREKRHRFLARAATAEWDAIIITHSAFKLIAVPANFERALIEEQIADYDALLAGLAKDGADYFTRKRVERLKEGLKEKLEASAARKDDMLTLDEIGVDQILVDEAQEFRKLAFTTNMDTLKGIDADGSQRAWDLYVKTRFLATRRPGRPLILASGTPITNTLGEMFSIQRYMDPEALAARGLNQFDAWASTFGDTRTELELQPSGLYKPVTRFSEFVNAADLIAMFRSFADVVQKQDLREILTLPAVRGGQRQIVTAPASDGFKAYQKTLAARIAAIENRSGRAKPGDDILLSVITDGRHASIDLRFVDPLAADDPCGKLNALIDNAFRIWKETAGQTYRRPNGEPFEKPGAAQMIFSDLGTPAVEASRGFSAYRWIRQRLIGLGVPAAEIAFMQDFKKAEAKQRLFHDVNSGRVRFLLGSSQTMGTGVNAQLRLKALHHLDVPWLPSEVEQREGRIERQGNQHGEIEIYAYATLGSTDATMWQANERKARFIAAALAGDRNVRRLEDMGAQANQFAMAKALASGDERLMRKAGLEAELARLERLRAAHFDDQLAVRHAIRRAEETIAYAERRIPLIEADIARRDGAGDAALLIGRSRYADPQQGGLAFLARLRQLVTARAPGSEIIGSYAGFDLVFEGGQRLLDRRFAYSVALRRNRSEDTLELNLSTTPRQVTATLAALVGGFEGELVERRAQISREQGRVADYRARLDGSFPHEEDLALKQAELKELEADLAAGARQQTEASS
ncbi:lactate dehydrogenase [Pseudoroseomonas sp. WGS1072]|uniref:lactate dehydrogenase n=1 Tax=Roseomonas sp. WGS1072 TaxID=3366816 RepID=UPI003BEFA1BE